MAEEYIPATAIEYDCDKSIDALRKATGDIACELRTICECHKEMTKTAIVTSARVALDGIRATRDATDKFSKTYKQAMRRARDHNHLAVEALCSVTHVQHGKQPTKITSVSYPESTQASVLVQVALTRTDLSDEMRTKLESILGMYMDARSYDTDYQTVMLDFTKLAIATVARIYV